MAHAWAYEAICCHTNTCILVHTYASILLDTCSGKYVPYFFENIPLGRILMLVWFPTLLCNIGSGIAHHLGFKASIVTPSNDQGEIK